MPKPIGIGNRPLHGLHATETSAHHGGELLNLQPVREPGLGIDPVFNGDNREISAVGLARYRINRGWARRAEARAKIIYAYNEKTVGIHRLARSHHVVPPAQGLRIIGPAARNMMGGIQGMTNEYCITA